MPIVKPKSGAVQGSPSNARTATWMERYFDCPGHSQRGICTTPFSPDALRDIFQSAQEHPLQTKQVFDLTAVPYMDSLGLGMLVSHAVRCRRKGIELRIASPSPRVQELFRLTGMKSVLPFEELQPN